MELLSPDSWRRLEDAIVVVPTDPQLGPPRPQEAPLPPGEGDDLVVGGGGGLHRLLGGQEGAGGGDHVLGGAAHQANVGGHADDAALENQVAQTVVEMMILPPNAQEQSVPC